MAESVLSDKARQPTEAGRAAWHAKALGPEKAARRPLGFLARKPFSGWA